MKVEPGLTREELLELRAMIAERIAERPSFLPLFERLDAAIAAHDADDPIARARALISAQKAMR